jgi:hypothetical protein
MAAEDEEIFNLLINLHHIFAGLARSSIFAFTFTTSHAKIIRPRTCCTFSRTFRRRFPTLVLVHKTIFVVSFFLSFLYPTAFAEFRLFAIASRVNIVAASCNLNNAFLIKYPTGILEEYCKWKEKTL